MSLPVRTEQYHEPLRGVPLFEVLTDEEFTRLCSHARVRDLEERECLFRHRDPAQHYFFLVDGELKLSRSSPDGGEKVIEIVRAGALFAEAVAFMSDRPVFPVTAEAIVACRVIAFDHETILDILRRSTDVCFRLLGQMSRRLHGMVNEIDRLTLHNGTFRFVLYLLQQIPDDAFEAPEIVLTTPKYVIASKLGVAPETFSRIESRLVGAGQIEIDGNHIVIRDVAALRKLVAV